MDLAHNLKRTSDEVKTLNHVIGLAKHDLAKVTFTVKEEGTKQPLANLPPLPNNGGHMSMRGTINPFS